MRRAGTPAVRADLTISLRSHLDHSRTESFQAAHIIGCLRQQPLAEHCDFGKRRSRLRADDPVRLGNSRNIDWPYKTTVDGIPSRQRSAGERNALAVDGGIYQHARAVQNRTVSDGDRSSRRPQTISTRSSSHRFATAEILTNPTLWLCGCAQKQAWGCKPEKAAHTASPAQLPSP